MNYYKNATVNILQRLWTFLTFMKNHLMMRFFFLPEVKNWIRWILDLVICESYHDCLNQHFFYLSSPEKSKRKCKVFWLTCIKDIRMQKQNRIKLRLNHQEKPKNLFSEMLSQDMERVDNMDMMPQGVLTFQLFELFNSLWLLVDQ